MELLNNLWWRLTLCLPNGFGGFVREFEGYLLDEERVRLGELIALVIGNCDTRGRGLGRRDLGYE